MKTMTLLFATLMTLTAQAQFNCDNGYNSGGDDRFASATLDQENLVITFHETTYIIPTDEEMWQASQKAKDSYSMVVQNRLITKSAEGEEYIEEINLMAIYNKATKQLYLTIGAYDDQYFYPRSEMLACK